MLQEEFPKSIFVPKNGGLDYMNNQVWYRELPNGVEYIRKDLIPNWHKVEEDGFPPDAVKVMVMDKNSYVTSGFYNQLEEKWHLDIELSDEIEYWYNPNVFKRP